MPLVSDLLSLDSNKCAFETSIDQKSDGKRLLFWAIIYYISKLKSRGVILLQNLTLGQYCPRKSLIHRLDPRTKFLTLIPIVIAVTLGQNFLTHLSFLVFLMVVIRLSKIPFAHFFRQLRIFFWIIIFTFFLHSFFGEGNPIFQIPIVGFSVTEEGVSKGLFFGLRLLLLISFSILVMLTTPPTDMTDGLEKLLRPLRKTGLKPDRFALMLGITLRFIPVLFEESDRIRKAQAARGVHFEGKIVSRIRNLASLVIPMFISVFNRADALAFALEARGYPGSGSRTYYNDLKFKTSDIIAAVTVISIASGTYLL